MSNNMLIDELKETLSKPKFQKLFRQNSELEITFFVRKKLLQRDCPVLNFQFQGDKLLSPVKGLSDEEIEKINDMFESALLRYPESFNHGDIVFNYMKTEDDQVRYNVQLKPETHYARF